MCGGWHSGSCGIDASSGFGTMMIAVVANFSGGSRTYAIMVVAYAYLCVGAHVVAGYAGSIKNARRTLDDFIGGGFVVIQLPLATVPSSRIFAKALPCGQAKALAFNTKNCMRCCHCETE